MNTTENRVVVSVITPTYNSSQFIGDTIESVLAQRFQDWEMLIVDDCSTDNSVEIANRFAGRDDRISTVQLSENSGAAVARNTAISKARGRYISFLDSDDIWLAHKLETQLDFMATHQAAFCFSSYNYIDVSLIFAGLC